MYIPRQLLLGQAGTAPRLADPLADLLRQGGVMLGRSGGGLHARHGVQSTRAASVTSTDGHPKVLPLWREPYRWVIVGRTSSPNVGVDVISADRRTQGDSECAAPALAAAGPSRARHPLIAGSDATVPAFWPATAAFCMVLKPTLPPEGL